METFKFGLKYWKRNIPLAIVSQCLSFISIIADLMFPMLTGILLNYIIKGIPMEEGAGGIFSFLLTGAYGQVQTFELFLGDKHRLKKVFWKGNFRAGLVDEIAIRVLMLLGKV